MNRWLRKSVLAICMVLLMGGCTSDSDDPAGPGEDEYFPADYEGVFRFNGLALEFPMEFSIARGGSVSGTVSGTNAQGEWYRFDITGSVAGGNLLVTIAGEYGPPECAVSGEIAGSSTDNYQTFQGTWTYVTCWNVTFRGTWEAHRRTE